MRVGSASRASLQPTAAPHVGLSHYRLAWCVLAPCSSVISACPSCGISVGRWWSGEGDAIKSEHMAGGVTHWRSIVTSNDLCTSRMPLAGTRDKALAWTSLATRKLRSNDVTAFVINSTAFIGAIKVAVMNDGCSDNEQQVNTGLSINNWCPLYPHCDCTLAVVLWSHSAYHLQCNYFTSSEGAGSEWDTIIEALMHSNDLLRDSPGERCCMVLYAGVAIRRNVGNIKNTHLYRMLASLLLFH